MNDPLRGESERGEGTMLLTAKHVEIAEDLVSGVSGSGEGLRGLQGEPWQALVNVLWEPRMDEMYTDLTRLKGL